MKNKLITTFILSFCLAGCNDNSDDTVNEQLQTNAVLQATEQIATQLSNPAATTIKATARLGDKEYQYATVFCIGGMLSSTILSDRQDDIKPEITVAPFAAGNLSKGRVTFDFRKTGERILWQLETGKVSKTDNGYTASGMLRGKRMVTQPNGNDKPMPMEDVDLKPFEVDVTC